MRLTVVATHPVQYLSPWFRYVTANCPQLDLSVVYASRPSPDQQGVGFGRALEWDLRLLDGYRWQVVRDSESEDNFGVGSFRGLDVKNIGQVVLDTRPDVVLVPGWHSITLVRAIMGARRRGIPVLYRGDTHLGLRPAGWRRMGWGLKTRVLLRLYSAYLSVGGASRAYLVAHGVPPTSIYASPHAVDNDLFATEAALHLTSEARAAARGTCGARPDDFVVLFAGKLTARKRPIDVVRAVAPLGRGAVLVIAGTGEQERELRAEAQRLGVRVGWLGFVNQSRMPAVYAAADCLVLPSEEESWGLAVNEAMATGLPAVVSDRVGCRGDLIEPGETGEVFRSRDPQSLADALRRVLERGGRNGRSAACRAKVANHGFAAATAGLAAACQSVARQASSRARVIACCGGMVVVAGLERMTFEVLRIVREHGGAVHCIVNGWENHRIVPLAERIGASWSVGYYGQTFSRRTTNPWRVAAMAWDVFRTSAGLLRDAVRFMPDHVLVPDYMSAVRNAPALLALRASGVEIILRLGNAPEAGRFFHVLWRYAINPLVDVFVCNSAFTKRELLAHGVPDRKVLQIYNAAPARNEAAGPSARDPRRIVYVGQIIPEKGAAELLEAVGLLVARGYDATLEVVGNIDGWISPSYGDFRERLLARAAAPDLAGRVRFLGWRENVSEILASAAVHCCPSQPKQREGFGLVTLEAKLAGTASVVTPVGALPELVTHGVDGWVCRDTSPEAIAEGLEYFLNSPERWLDAGRAARRAGARFSHDAFSDKWTEVFA